MEGDTSFYTLCRQAQHESLQPQPTMFPIEALRHDAALDFAGGLEGAEVNTTQDCQDIFPQKSAVRVSIQLATLVLIFVTSFVSNCVVFIVFYRKPSLLNTSNRYVLNLAVSNFLMTLLVMPFVFTSTLTFDWLLGNLCCQIVGILTTVLFVSCIMTLLLISVDRYYAIIKPLHYDLSPTAKKASYLIGSVWLISLLIAMPPVIGWNRITYQPNKGICTVDWKAPHYADRMYSFFIVLVCFIVPYALSLFIYVRVFHTAQKSNALARRNSVTADQTLENGLLSLNGPMIKGLPASNQRRRSSITSLLQAARRRSSGTTRNFLGNFHRDDWRAAKTSLLIMSTFTLCWLPFFILIVLEASFGRAGAVPGWVEASAIWVALASCALNPIVYVFRSSGVKQELKVLFTTRPPERISRNSTSSSLRESWKGSLRDHRDSLRDHIQRKISVASELGGGSYPIRKSSLGGTGRGAPVTFRISPSPSCTSIPETVDGSVAPVHLPRPASTAMVTFADGVKGGREVVPL